MVLARQNGPSFIYAVIRVWQLRAYAASTDMHAPQTHGDDLVHLMHWPNHNLCNWFRSGRLIPRFAIEKKWAGSRAGKQAGRQASIVQKCSERVSFRKLRVSRWKIALDITNRRQVFKFARRFIGEANQIRNFLMALAYTE